MAKVDSWKLTNLTTSPELFPAITMTVVRDRTIRTRLRTNQIVGFVTMPSWEMDLITVNLLQKPLKCVTHISKCKTLKYIIQ